MDRICIFIDGSNFYHALKAAHWPTSIDFGKLSHELTGEDRQHKHTYYYNTHLPQPRSSALDFPRLNQNCRNQQKFFEGLRFISDLTFRRGRFQKLPSGKQVEKGVDVTLAVDMLTLAFKDRYDVAILISSDADYKYAVEMVKNETGKIVELRQVEGNKAYDFVTACDRYKPIRSEVIQRCLRNQRVD